MGSGKRSFRRTMKQLRNIIRLWLIRKLGGIVEEIDDTCKYKVSQVFLTGEKRLDGPGRKPQGYNIYRNGLLIKYLPRE